MWNDFILFFFHYPENYFSFDDHDSFLSSSSNSACSLFFFTLHTTKLCICVWQLSISGRLGCMMMKWWWWLYLVDIVTLLWCLSYTITTTTIPLINRMFEWNIFSLVSPYERGKNQKKKKTLSACYGVLLHTLYILHLEKNCIVFVILVTILRYLFSKKKILNLFILWILMSIMFVWENFFYSIGNTHTHTHIDRHQNQKKKTDSWNTHTHTGSTSGSHFPLDDYWKKIYHSFFYSDISPNFFSLLIFLYCFFLVPFYSILFHHHLIWIGWMFF